MRHELDYLWWQESQSRPTIVVSEMTDAQKEERAKKIEQGAQVVPFGFSRVLQEES